jgi:hypothetical protein
MTTQAEFWVSRQGTWITVRNMRRCDGWNLYGPGKHCEQMIEVGERALSTGIMDRGRMIILCSRCAALPVIVNRKNSADIVSKIVPINKHYRPYHP